MTEILESQKMKPMFNLENLLIKITKIGLIQNADAPTLSHTLFKEKVVPQN